MIYLYAFLIGGALCGIGQVLIDKTTLTPAKVLVIYIVSGVVLTALGIYEPIVELAGTGATIPLTGFGYALAKGTIEAVSKEGVLGALTGGLTATAVGLEAAIFFGFLIAFTCKPKAK